VALPDWVKPQSGLFVAQVVGEGDEGVVVAEMLMVLEGCGCATFG
jgi:hypothetical protein